jgi:hypothetical protein
MKYLNKFLILALVCVGFSCTDLNESLNSDFTNNFSPNNPGYGESENVNQPVPSDGMNSAFSQLLGGTAAHEGYFSVSEIPTDQVVITQKGGDWFDGGIWLNMHRHDFFPTNPGLNNAWAANYGGVSQINQLLANGGLDANQVAQLRTLRAYFYWRLSDMFGRIKIITQPGVDSPQVDRPEVFNFIVSEIEAALPDLNESAGYARISSGAANALLARLYLNGEVYTRPYPYTPGTGTTYWQEAIDAADEVINSGLYELETNPGDPQVAFDNAFGPANVGSSEHIFVIPYDEATGQGMQFAQMTLHYPSQLTYDLAEQPWNGYSSLEAFYDSFSEDDARKEAFFVAGPQTDREGNPILDVAFNPENEAETGDTESGAAINYTPVINELEPNGARQAGARLGKFSFKIGQQAHMDNDYPLLRYGDVLLMKAEAVARQSNNWSNGTTLLLVNDIRERAGLDDVGSLTADEFFAERGKEMFMESIRRTDMIRFQKWGDAWWEKPAHSTAYRNIMPIPDPQILATTEGEPLTQHPDY